MGSHGKGLALMDCGEVAEGHADGEGGALPSWEKAGPSLLPRRAGSAGGADRLALCRVFLHKPSWIEWQHGQDGKD